MTVNSKCNSESNGSTMKYNLLDVRKDVKIHFYSGRHDEMSERVVGKC